jgi:Laminin G domain
VYKTVVGIAAGAVVLLSAGMGVGPAAATTLHTVALWNMNEAPGSTVLVDSSGNGLNGTIGTSIALNGAYQTFPTITRGSGGTVDPQHLDIINSPLLNPGTSDFIVTVRLLIPSVAASLGNVMQKGQTGTVGGFWKIQLDTGNGHVICEFVSPTGSGGIASSQVVADDQWHTVTCERSATTVSTTVDGVTTQVARTVGAISNNIPLSIGGKSLCTATPMHDCDYFVGSIQSVQIQTATNTPRTGFTPLTSTRVLDTRNGTGAPQGPVAAGGTVHLALLGAGGVPSSGVSAVALNVTATSPTRSGFVTAYPDGTAMPATSNLNFVAGQTVTNLVVVPVGADGAVALTNGSGGSSQLVGDVAGYYVGGAAAPGSFGSLTPARVLDTRNGTGAPVGQVAPEATVHLAVLGAGGVPRSGVSAVLLNVTATGATRSGFITAYPDGTVMPTASNLNFVAGQTVANLVVAPVGADGSVALTNGSVGHTSLIADVAGYYVGGAGGSGSFASLTPARVLDTRNGTGAPMGQVAPGGTVHLAVLGAGGVPKSGVSAVVLNVTATGSTSSGFVTAYADGTTAPNAWNLSFATGQNVANLVVVPVGADGSVALTNGSVGHTSLIADVAGYFLQ